MLVDDVNITGQWLTGSEAADNIAGGNGHDYLRGDAGADVMSGGDGDDHFADLSADDSTDTLTGGSGRDIYYFLPVRSNGEAVVADVITDFTAGNGGDIIRLSVSNPNPFQGGGLRLVQMGSDTVVMQRDGNGADQALVRLQGVTASALTAANFDGVSIAIDNSIIINDNDDGNALDGSPLDDRIFGNGGNDAINGYAGNDRLAGGADNDVIDGGLGDDFIAGQEGADQINGGAGSDVMSGGTGDDIIIGHGAGGTPIDIDVFKRRRR